MNFDSSSSKLTRLLNQSKPGVPILTCDLREAGISARLASHYVKNGWLNRIGYGAYCLPNERVTLDGALLVLQKDVPGLHLASFSALNRWGVRHNLTFNEKAVVWGEPTVGLPKWVHESFNVRYSSAKLFAFKDSRLDFDTRPVFSLDNQGVFCSVIERGVLELLSESGTFYSPELTRNIVESVRRLRPEVLGPLLLSCTSLKVKRLFALLATEFNLIDVSRLYSEYDITTGEAKQWQVTVGKNKTTTIRKVKLVHEAELPQSSRVARRDHPVLLRLGSAGLKRRNRA